MLTRDEFWCPNFVAIVRLLILTDCRVGEIRSLEWDWIRGERIFLPDSKSGPHTVPLGKFARAIVDGLPGPQRKDLFLFPKTPNDAPRTT